MKEEILKILEQYHQEHLLNYIPLLNQQEQETLENQILKLNFENLKHLYETTTQEIKMEEKIITNIPYTDKAKLSQEKLTELQAIGSNIISNGKYAVVTMAGGQGTRLRTFWTKRDLLFEYHQWP